ncbi:MAG TPA: hypothetical protein VGH79_11300 [Gaiellaceae bacterium]|jgi:hypothetical protein
MRVKLCLPLAVVSVLAVALSACGGSAPTVQRASFVIGADSLAGLPMSPGTSYLGASRYFERKGFRSSRRITRDGDCRLELKTIGFSADFWSFANRATPRKCTDFGGAFASGPRWHTANGLRVGASVAELHRLFPHALSGGPWNGSWWGPGVGVNGWYLGPKWPANNHAAHTILIAYVKDGRVFALGEEVSGH